MIELIDFIRESNRIEGIVREPLPLEVQAHDVFLDLPSVTTADMANFVNWVADVPLRDRSGMNVQVGPHIAPPGGPDIIARLSFILDRANNRNAYNAFELHREYETLHPFMDGNGRSGRVLWLWMMGGIDKVPLGFLHTWYYQSLQAGR